MILDLTKINNIYISSKPVDLRQSIDGLSATVQESFKLNPFGNSLFVFTNKNHNKIKILHWDNNGFWIYYKRLEEGTFKWPKAIETSNLKLEEYEFMMLLDGLKLNQQKRFKTLNYEAVI